LSWLSSFSPPFADALKNAISAADRTSPPVAAFDADNTLWSKDIGEAFLRWLIAGRILKNVNHDSDVYGDYERRVEKDRTSAYAWAVSTMEGLRLTDVRLWSAQLAYAWPNYRPLMRTLVRELKNEGFDVWIVSASNAWTVQEAAKYVGIEPDRVLGITCDVKDGTVTGNVQIPITCNKGKVEAIQKYIGRRPTLAFGDSLGDLEMLEYAAQPMVVLDCALPNTPLSNLASQRHWPVQKL